MKINSILLAASALTLISGAIFFSLFEKYEYYDYHRGESSVSSILIKANLYGEFKKDSPTVRSGPYSLGVVIVGYSGAENREIIITQVLFRSVSSNKAIQLPAAIKTQLMEKNNAPEMVYSFRNLNIPYEDYEMRGVVSDPSGKVKPSFFSIKIVRKYRSEWRMTLWDNLMSV